MPSNFGQKLQIKLHKVALPKSWILFLVLYKYCKREKLNVKRAIEIVTGRNVFFGRNVVMLLVKTQHLYVSDDLYTVPSYSRDSLTIGGDRKKERNERE